MYSNRGADYALAYRQTSQSLIALKELMIDFQRAFDKLSTFYDKSSQSNKSRGNYIRTYNDIRDYADCLGVEVKNLIFDINLSMGKE